MVRVFASVYADLYFDKFSNIEPRAVNKGNISSNKTETLCPFFCVKFKSLDHG
ncbi:hypothetical protein MICAC_3080026 [Microcystis aeruginosa PCC 9443]|uniref:Uncharacterized protein n=1 Tax=Microcystis aeruginosa PCC 9443 TaxID=1160281 RepID=I4G2P6_MICAE|nr:hypothetical protein MICAC_3080026 [Microcystis aeruginosa PCC 9443]